MPTTRPSIFLSATFVLAALAIVAVAASPLFQIAATVVAVGIGAPFYFCALLQAAAMVVARRHFVRQRERAAAGATLAGSAH